MSDINWKRVQENATMVTLSREEVRAIIDALEHPGGFIQVLDEAQGEELSPAYVLIEIV